MTADEIPYMLADLPEFLAGLRRALDGAAPL